MQTIYTIGHSTHPIGEFLEMLDSFGIRRVADIRTVPGSRHNPQYGQKALDEALTKHGIGYIHLKALGGLRKGTTDSVNLGWRNLSFRHYADYMQTDAFAAGIDEIIRLADEMPTAIMCAEAVPWRCHRSLVSDALAVRGVKVLHIMGRGKAHEHTMTPFACVDGTHITYPAAAETDEGESPDSGVPSG